jgi:acetyl-CoA decarbonylase/synthase complex subunit delta
MHLELPRESFSTSIEEVTLGASSEGGGSRSTVIKLGGARLMPLMSEDEPPPNPPVIGMEVFDSPPVRLPCVLRDIYGDLLADPAAMATRCVEQYGAELISLRLDGAHPDRGDRGVEELLDVVASVLEAVGVPIMVTGVAHFEKNNEVMRAVAERFAGENLLLNWIETDNYKTISAAAMAYDHCVVALSPVDVNMAKQLNILATGIGLQRDKLIMDPMMSPLGYGLDYSYTISERIKLSGLSGDDMLAFPIIFNVGYECAKIKELYVDSGLDPRWGRLDERVPMWEIVTGAGLLAAGADLLVVYHPKAAEVLRRKISAVFSRQKEVA